MVVERKSQQQTLVILDRFPADTVLNGCGVANHLPLLNIVITLTLSPDN